MYVASPAFVMPTTPALRGHEPNQRLLQAAPGGSGTVSATLGASSSLTLGALGALGAVSRKNGPRKARAQAIAMRASVDELIAEHEVIAFISQTCPFCQQAVAALTDAGYPPFIVEAETFSDIRSELTEKTSSSSVPKVWVKGNFIGGCNDGGMGGVLPLLKSGKIQELMS